MEIKIIDKAVADTDYITYKENNSEIQLDLFDDIYQQRIFSCIAGAYIGRFTGDGDNPILRLSDYFSSKEIASKALVLLTVEQSKS